MEPTNWVLLTIVAWNDYNEVMIASKLNPIGPLHAEKTAEAVLLYVFEMSFTASTPPRRHGQTVID